MTKMKQKRRRGGGESDCFAPFDDVFGPLLCRYRYRLLAAFAYPFRCGPLLFAPFPFRCHCHCYYFLLPRPMAKQHRRRGALEAPSRASVAQQQRLQQFVQRRRRQQQQQHCCRHSLPLLLFPRLPRRGRFLLCCPPPQAIVVAPLLKAKPKPPRLSRQCPRR